MQANSVQRFTFQGVNISALNQQNAIDILLEENFDKPAYICFPDSYTVLSAKKNTALKQILNAALLTMPDGKPLEFAARKQELKNVTTVSGFWTCKALLADNSKSHFFYGSRPNVLERLEVKLKKEFPQANILGFRSPPFVELDAITTSEIIQTDIKEIAGKKPDYIWIGLSSPKQDYLMAHFYATLSGGVMLGIGGVFEYLSGDVQKSPEWVKKLGLRWLYRLLKEPKRLWRKYFFVMRQMMVIMLTPKGR